MKKLLKGIFICLFAIFLMSHNVFAADIAQTNVQYYKTLDNVYFTCGSGWQIKNNCSTGGSITGILMYDYDNTTLPGGEYYFEVYLEIMNNDGNAPIWYGADGGNYMTLVSEEMVSSTTRSNFTVRVYRLLYHWAGGTNLGYNQQSGGNFGIRNTATIFNSSHYRVNSIAIWRVIPSGSSISDVITSINDQSAVLRSIDTNIIYGVGHLETIEDYLEGLEGMGQDVGDIKDQLEQRQQQEDDALDNIENQSPEDISESGETENQATTNLIGLFQSFITALSGITQTNNCNITLAFPSYAGGNITVNVCQNKDKGGNIVAVFSSLTLIIFYIPLALKLLSMIYNEIRSFTNG